MKNYLISVIVPVYNVEKYLNRCIESIVNQSYKNLEIILVDDGSTDSCPKMCDEWAVKDCRIRVLHLKNSGAANARNAALLHALGDYISFADSDDYLEPDMYEQLLETALNHNADITLCSYQINDESRGEKASASISQIDAMRQLVTGNYGYGVLWNKLYKSEIIKGIEMPKLIYSEDLVFNYYALKNAAVAAENQLKLYHYYQNEASAVHRKFDKNNYDAVTARKIIFDDASSDFKEAALYGYILSLFVFLNSIIETDNCTDMLDKVRSEILKYKNEIKNSDAFSKKEKMKTVFLAMGFKVYKTAFMKLK